MVPNEDPASPYTGPTPPGEDWEHWLRDLRTEAEEDPFGHPAARPQDEAPAPSVPAVPAVREERRGRHRAPD